MRPRRSIATAVMFLVFAVMFSVIFWPEVPLVAKIAFFATGVGCGASFVRSVHPGAKGGND